MHTHMHTQSIILQIVKKACAIPLVATDLVWNQGLLSWLQHVGIAKGCVPVTFMLL